MYNNAPVTSCSSPSPLPSTKFSAEFVARSSSPLALIPESAASSLFNDDTVLRRKRRKSRRLAGTGWVLTQSQWGKAYAGRRERWWWWFTSAAGSKGLGNRTWPNGDIGVDGVSDDEARRWCSTEAGAYCCWYCWNRRWNCWCMSASMSAVFRCLCLCRLLASDAPPAAAYMVVEDSRQRWVSHR